MDILPDFFQQSFLGTPVWFWSCFMALVVLILVFDLGLFNRKDHEIGYKESLVMSSIYVSLALLFGIWVWISKGSEAGLDFYTGYLVEYSLSIDNIFMISVIFAYFQIPRIYQHRVLFWGILGVVVLRGLMISIGAALIHEFSWILLIFGAFLIFSGAKMLLAGDVEEEGIEDSRIVRFLEKHLRVTRDLHGHDFLVRKKSPKTGEYVIYATPLLLALITIELVDLIFAVDSIPAVFAITTDSFIVFTSNIFAVLGLRTLYFLLAAMVNQFRFLQPAVSVVLVFIGCKVFYAHFFGKVDSVFSLGLTLGVLATGVIMSVLMPARIEHEIEEEVEERVEERLEEEHRKERAAKRKKSSGKKAPAKKSGSKPAKGKA
jgi:tellurite resistance protein TerC